MFVEELFKVPSDVITDIRRKPYKFGFDGFGELVYYTNYSRLLPDGRQETWIDTCTRVVEGVMSIRKSWYHLHNLKWDNEFWESIAADLLYNIYTLRVLPPGRGLWAQGTQYIYERGAMALNNCAATLIESETFAEDLGWAMDALMCGTGVGVRPVIDESFRDKLETYSPKYLHTIPDSREGWVESAVMLINCYRKDKEYKWTFSYDSIRKKGTRITGFGGTASGPEPLIVLHSRIREYMEAYIAGKYSYTRLSANIINAIGACIIAGNVRRSAEIIVGSPHDTDFKHLSNYDKFPERAEIGWMSNNSYALETKSDFNKIDEIAEEFCDRGEGGLVNFKNIKKYGRFGDTTLQIDEAVCPNPCVELGIYNKGVCNLFEVYPHKAKSKKEFLNMCRLAAIYTTSVSLLPTHSPETNQVIAKNRRIGVSLSGVADWFDYRRSKIVSFMRAGYSEVKEYAGYMNGQAGVPAPIRVTTIKPSGSVSQLAGVSPGMHFPLFTHAIRRMRLSNTSPALRLCAQAGYPIEADVNNKETTSIVEYPIYTGGTRPSYEISAWEQLSLLALLQREWADNMVSCTIHFTEKEKKDIPRMMAYFLPVIKSVSFLLKQDGMYPQMPYEKITEEEYTEKISKVKPIDWSGFSGSDGKEDKFCTNDSCEV